jgi:DNA recombination-dependent growth factor C
LSNNIKNTQKLLKNVTFLQVSGDELLEQLYGKEDNLEAVQFAVNPHQKQSIGLVPPSPYDERLYYESVNNHNILWHKLRIHKRSVSKDKLNDAVQQRLNELGMTEDSYDEEDFKSFIDSVESSLLPNANYTNKDVLFNIDATTGSLKVFSASNAEVEVVTSIVETILGEMEGLEVETVTIDSLSDTLTAMLIDSSLPDPIEWGSKLLLVNPDTKAKGSLDNQSVASLEAHTMIETGKYWKSGKFVYDGFITFELNDESKLKGLTFDNTIECPTEEETFEQTLIYVDLEVGNLYSNLQEKLKG